MDPRQDTNDEQDTMNVDKMTREQLVMTVEQLSFVKEQQAARAATLADENLNLIYLLHKQSAEITRLAKHSELLNTVSWRIAKAIGAVPDGAERVEGRDILADLDVLLNPNMEEATFENGEGVTKTALAGFDAPAATDDAA